MNKRIENKIMKNWIVFGIIAIFFITGEILCIVKAVRCNWNPIGKAEIIYTGASLTGFGGIVGWFNIEDK